MDIETYQKILESKGVNVRMDETSSGQHVHGTLLGVKTVGYIDIGKPKGDDTVTLSIDLTRILPATHRSLKVLNTTLDKIVEFINHVGAYYDEEEAMLEKKKADSEARKLAKQKAKEEAAGWIKSNPDIEAPINIIVEGEEDDIDESELNNWDDEEDEDEEDTKKEEKGEVEEYNEGVVDDKEPEKKDKEEEDDEQIGQ